ncbi:MAG: hypothetical protein ACI9LM_000419 [Alteromonadaceae bacterium]|jgi:hypothetical protein
MEYRQVIFNESITNSLTCHHCGTKQHRIIATIKYAFLFLEYLPFFPVKKSFKVSCQGCQNTYENIAIDRDIYKKIKKDAFKIRLLIPMYSGAIITVFFLIFWAYGKYQAALFAKEYIQAPKVNDFYYIDHSGIKEHLRPNQKYLLAKVVSINNNIVSMVFSSFRFGNKTSIEKDLRGGMVIDSRYFNKKHHLFSVDQLTAFFEDNTVLMVKRPFNYRLFGNIVVTEPFADNKKVGGRRENDQGLAFMQESNVQSNLENAEKYFLQSAIIGYSKGQLNLARLYLTSKRLDEGLYWLEKSALQGNEQAIKLYWDTCTRANNCDMSSFEQALSDSGFIIQ